MQASANRLEEKEVNELIKSKNKINNYFSLCLELQAIANANKNIIYKEPPYILGKKNKYGDKQLTVLRPGKYIYNFNTKAEALEFKAKTEKILNKLNKKTEEKQKKLYLKIKTIDGGGQVKLRKTAAYNTTKTTVQKLADKTKTEKKELQANIAYLEDLAQDTENAKTLANIGYELDKAREILADQERLLKALKNLDPNTKLSVSAQGATLWRLTYWDNLEEKRKQIAFGDIVIFYGCVTLGINYTSISNASRQKQRTDTREKDPNLIFQTELEGLKNLYIRKVL
ncbi:MAG: hypothetical protein E6235_09685 [Anaerococcus vaginalis]|uniref:hypothetical protein n=1 Tax=Anaerococcus vaginalis TaxID=33037 RepID=UPI0029070272|nr:hypothetical protein [Anaerococcus vaginalis]MDU5087268.1 hypothetical protein [Anaerococcus vaginalis]